VESLAIESLSEGAFPIMPVKIMPAHIRKTYNTIRNSPILIAISTFGLLLGILLIGFLSRVVFFPAQAVNSFPKPAQTISASPRPVQTGSSSLLFDRPLNVLHQPLSPAPDDPNRTGTLSCYYFPHFMVKEIDVSDNIGAEMLSVTQFSEGGNKPQCLEEKAGDEHVIESGSFEGARGDFLFFDTALEGDGEQFDVFTNTGEKILEDLCVSMDGISAKLIPPMAQSTPEIRNDTGIELRYDRVYVAQCSFGDDHHNCWTNAMKETGLKEAFSPECSTATVITFGVRVVLHTNPVSQQGTIVSKIKSCYAGE
jgi:hypothetical protein